VAGLFKAMWGKVLQVKWFSACHGDAEAEEEEASLVLKRSVPGKDSKDYN
jgi:hypothetical protein